MTSNALWTPSDRRIAQSEIVRFGAYLGKQASQNVADGSDLSALALDNLERF